MKTANQRAWITSLFLFCAGGFLLAGCQAARMAVPKDLQNNSKKLTVKGRSLSDFGKSFDFAPYQVTEIDRGWTKGKGFSVSSDTTEFSSSKARQKYQFSVNESGASSWKVQCATGAKWNKLETEGFIGGRFSIELTPKKQLACTLNQENGAQA